MIIRIKAADIRKALAGVAQGQELVNSIRWKDESDLASVTIDKAHPAVLAAFQAHLAKDPAYAMEVRRLQALERIKADPEGRPVGQLDQLAVAIQNFVRWKSRWLWSMGDGGMLPWYLASVTYHPYDKRSESPARVTLVLSAMVRGTKTQRHVTFHTDDLRGDGKGRTVAEVLGDDNLFAPTAECQAEYEKAMATYAAYRVQDGAQFTGLGNGQASSRYSTRSHALVRDGVPAKLVMDDQHEEGGQFGDDDGMTGVGFWRNQATVEDGEEDDDAPADDGVDARAALPVHPIVKVFDLDAHCHVVLRSTQLHPYAWRTDLGDKLVLPEKHRKAVAVLMATACDDIQDVIAGKSSGTIVVCTGDPGLGKTLTAEVTSEVIQRPLYKVQCSQLGTCESDIEKKLAQVLNRAERWKALLLIDEANVYVRARGADIQQNAIVVVFLRVLEYYRGVLFLTSNRATVIDDAIMSRATVHVKYEHPAPVDLCRIWDIQAELMGAKLPAKAVADLVNTFPHATGRDVRNLLRLGVRYAGRDPKKLNAELLKGLAHLKDLEPCKTT